MGMPATLRKHSIASPFIAEACQPTASVRSISLPHTLRSAPPPTRLNKNFLFFFVPCLSSISHLQYHHGGSAPLKG